MDVFYASVGTALDWTGSSKPPNNTLNSWQSKLLATAAAASFYSLTGARDRAATVTSSSETAQHLIQNAWGMVSLPAVKNLSLQATRLLKGAAVADRVELCGVSCFILCSEPIPELAAAIQRSHRLRMRRKPIPTLSTINEDYEHAPTRRSNSKPFARQSGRYRQRDVIFHLTGGGFFAHIIASDLPYLLDWSASTGAVIVCPEYALLPEHTYPRALNQIAQVYHELVSNTAIDKLGFEVGKLVVTGESAGGNLAAAFCVKLCLENCSDKAEDVIRCNQELEAGGRHADDGDSDMVQVHLHKENEDDMAEVVRMPDALMLSCPVLNLSLETSHSRIVGTEDPVLPSGLLSAISDAYLPPSMNISKKNPLASPFYAPDWVLQNFPPTLLFASSNDPVLDDSVVFNQRLRTLGVDSNLFAAHNLPHAYLGLGTAGFPEALQVQHQCIEWLMHQLTRDDAGVKCSED
jgi:acetyl esterase/lipase